MHSAAKLKNEAPILDDMRESQKVTSRARLSIAELLRKPFDVRSIALTGLFVLAIFYTTYFMRSVLLPIVLAVLLSYLFRPIVRTLARVKLPPVIGAAVILVALLALISYGVSSLLVPFVGLLEKATAVLSELQHNLIPLKRSM